MAKTLLGLTSTIRSMGFSTGTCRGTRWSEQDDKVMGEGQGAGHKGRVAAAGNGMLGHVIGTGGREGTVLHVLEISSAVWPLPITHQPCRKA